MIVAILIGFAFGFIGSMPVAGPIAMVVLRLALGHHERRARFVAMGGALAEGIYALLAFWGLSRMLDRHPHVLPATRIVGGALCLVLGVALLFRKAQPRPTELPPTQSRGTKRSLLGGFLITALNPTLIVTWTAALAALHSTGLVDLSPDRAVPFALAVFVGIVAWFSTLLWVVRRYKGAWSPQSVEWFIKAMGAALVVASLWIGAREWRAHRRAAPAAAVVP
jgi:threonine/homoserine/homoserine lactone efflux protein